MTSDKIVCGEILKLMFPCRTLVYYCGDPLGHGGAHHDTTLDMYFSLVKNLGILPFTDSKADLGHAAVCKRCGYAQPHDIKCRMCSAEPFQCAVQGCDVLIPVIDNTLERPKKTFKVEDSLEWVPLEKEGKPEKFLCPKCKNEMVIGGVIAYAYCLACRQYWVQKEKRLGTWPSRLGEGT